MEGVFGLYTNILLSEIEIRIKFQRPRFWLKFAGFWSKPESKFG